MYLNLVIYSTYRLNGVNEPMLFNKCMHHPRLILMNLLIAKDTVKKKKKKEITGSQVESTGYSLQTSVGLNINITLTIKVKQIICYIKKKAGEPFN